jgi:hypothetical protein
MRHEVVSTRCGVSRWREPIANECAWNAKDSTYTRDNVQNSLRGGGTVNLLR